MWTLLNTFMDPMPYEFTLQVGQSENPEADDWTAVGAPVTNQFYAIDPEQRVFNKLRTQFYRIKLKTPKGFYLSAPTGLLGTLAWRDWLAARTILREELFRMRKTHAGQDGYLLKRRMTGTPCPQCLDYQTNEVKQPSCPYCHGTGWLNGYFFPMECVWADIDPKTYHTKIDGSRGTTQDIVVKARMANTWVLSEEDIWVNRVSDERYYIHTIQNVAEYRGVPLIASVELRPAPATDCCYLFEIPQQIAGVT